MIVGQEIIPLKKKKLLKIVRISLVFLILCSIFMLGFYAGVKQVNASANDKTYQWQNKDLFNGEPQNLGATWNVRNQTAPTGNFSASDSFDYNMSKGNYYGTYDFRDDSVGSIPSGWTNNSGTGCSINVTSSIDGHNKVVQLYDNGAGRCELTTPTFNQVSGTIELWFYSTDTSKLSKIIICDTTQNLFIQITSGIIQYRYNSAYHSATNGAVSNNQWYHFRIVFDCSSDTYDFYKNGALLDSNIPFNSGATSLKYIWFATDEIPTGYYSYFDAIGYSWDTTSHSGLGYAVGENVNPYDITPLMQNNFEVSFPYFGTTVNITSDNSHNNILTIHRFSTTNSYALISKDFTSNQVSGTIEFWFKTDDNTKTSYPMQLMDGATVGINSLVYGQYFQYYDGSFHSTGISCQSNTWYHLKYVFNCSTHTFDWYINGILEISDGTFQNNIGIASSIRVFMDYASNSLTSYWDALGFSWDTNYNVGDNKDPSFYTTNTLEADKMQFATDASGTQITNIANILDWTPTYVAGHALTLATSGYDSQIKWAGTDTTTAAAYLTYSNFTLSDSDYIEYNIGTNSSNDGLTEFDVNFYATSGVKLTLAQMFTNNLGVYYVSLYYSLTSLSYTGNPSAFTLIGTDTLSYPSYSQAPTELNTTFYLNQATVKWAGFQTTINTTNPGFSIARQVWYNGRAYWPYFYSLNYVQLIVNGNSLSHEGLYQNINDLTLKLDQWDLSKYNFVDLTLNGSLTNNLNLTLSNGHVLFNNTQCKTSYGNTISTNIYQDKILNNPTIAIDNSSAYQILNLRIYGIALVEGTHTYFPTYTFTDVNLNQSYFYVQNNELHYNLWSQDTNTNSLELSVQIIYFNPSNYFFSMSMQKNNMDFTSYLSLYYIGGYIGSFQTSVVEQNINSALTQNAFIYQIYVKASDMGNAGVGESDSGYFSSLGFRYTEAGTLTALNITTMLIPLMIILLPSIAFYYALLKKNKQIAKYFSAIMMDVMAYLCYSQSTIGMPLYVFVSVLIGSIGFLFGSTPFTLLMSIGLIGSAFLVYAGVIPTYFIYFLILGLGVGIFMMEFKSRRDGGGGG